MTPLPSVDDVDLSLQDRSRSARAHAAARIITNAVNAAITNLLDFYASPRSPSGIGDRRCTPRPQSRR